MKSLVTGGAGFIGSHVVGLLLSEGHDVTVLDSLASGYRENLGRFPEARLIVGDVRDLSLLRVAARGAEVIFHLAASVGNKRSIEHPRLDAEINVLGTLNVLETARDIGVRKVVFSSSAGVFGELKTIPISENHPAEPTSPYGATKLCGEKLCLAYANIYTPIEAVCLRYFNVYGVNQRYDAYGNVIPIFAYRLLRRECITVFGDGEQTRDFINVADVARANLLAAKSRGLSGAFNVGSGSRVSINALVTIMRETSGLDAKVLHAPLRAGDVRDSLADISAIRSTLGFEARVDLRSGLREYIDWAKTSLSGWAI